MGSSTRATTALLAALLALLVATAPVAADHTAFLVGQHTTDSDFRAAATLDNVTVDGSGAGASVELDSAIIDSFEDGSLDEYAGSPSDWEIRTGDATHGSRHLYATVGSTEIGSDFTLRQYRKGEGNYSVDVKLNGSNTLEAYFGLYSLNEVLVARVSASELEFLTRTNGLYNTEDTTPISPSTTQYLTLDIDWDDDDTVAITLLDRSTGAVVGSLSTTEHLDDADEGTRIGFHTFDAGVQFDNARTSADLAASGTYVSQAHTVSEANLGYTNLSLTNAQAIVTWEGSNGGSWTEVASTTYSASGNRTQAFSGTYSDYRVNVTFVRQSGATTAELHDEGVLVSNRAPVISNLSPSDGSAISSEDVTLEADVADANFDEGESVEVAFTVNGSVVDTQTITSNQTVSATVSVGGGEHTWSVSAEDQTHTTDTATLTFATPGTIYVHDGDAPATLLADRTIDAEFVGTGTSSNVQTTRSTSNGTFPLGGLSSEELRVRLNASGYAERVLILSSSAESRRTVMYNASASSTFEQCFLLDSRGAGFAPDETKLTVQAYLNGQWRDVGGKYFGAANLACFSLQDGEDYRLAVTDGRNTRNLGGYEADQSFENDVITLVVEGLTFGLDRGEDYRWQAQLTNESGSAKIVFKIDSMDQNLEDLEVQIWERGNPSNVLDTLSTTGAVGVYSADFALTDAQAQQEWVVNWTAEYPGGELATGQTIVSLAGPASTIVPDGVPSEVLLGLMVGLVILLAMTFGGELIAPVGMGITVAFAGLLVLLGVLPISTDVFVLAVGLAVVGYIGFGVFGR